MPKIAKWKRFEQEVKKIQEQLSPNCEVIHDYKIMGVISGVQRQVDIALLSKIGQFDIFIALECKDYNKPVDVKDVESFISMVRDIKADKGVMISYMGFTEAAKSVATFNSVELMRHLDTESKDWPVKISLAIIIKDKRIQNYQVRISSKYDSPMTIPTPDMRYLLLFESEKKCLGSVTDILKMKWNNDEISDAEGKNELSLIKVYIKDDKNYYPCDVTISYTVKEVMYYGQLGVEELKGFYKESSKAVVTKELVTERVSFQEIENSWQSIKSVGEVEYPPTIIMEIRSGY